MAAPDAPTGVTATARDGAVLLTWDTPTDTTITKHQFRMVPAGGGIGHWVLTDIPNSGHDADFVDNYLVSGTGLTNDTTYYFRVAAVNDDGASADSDLAFAKPTEGAHPSKHTPVSYTHLTLPTNREV